jgi:hypothetical protein
MAATIVPPPRALLPPLPPPRVLLPPLPPPRPLLPPLPQGANEVDLHRATRIYMHVAKVLVAKFPDKMVLMKELHRHIREALIVAVRAPHHPRAAACLLARLLACSLRMYVRARVPNPGPPTLQGRDLNLSFHTILDYKNSLKWLFGEEMFYTTLKQVESRYSGLQQPRPHAATAVQLRPRAATALQQLPCHAGRAVGNV